MIESCRSFVFWGSFVEVVSGLVVVVVLLLVVVVVVMVLVLV